MIIKTVKFEDLNGKEIKRDFAFHLSKAEVAEIKFRKDGSDLNDVLLRIAQEENVRDILDMFKEIVVAAVGEKHEDGIRFVKNDRIRGELMESDAYSELLFEMIDDAKFAGDFIQGMLPSNMQKNVKTALGGKDGKDLTKEELIEKLKALESQDTQNKNTQNK